MVSGSIRQLDIFYYHLNLGASFTTFGASVLIFWSNHLKPDRSNQLFSLGPPATS